MNKNVKFILGFCLVVLFYSRQNIIQAISHTFRSEQSNISSSNPIDSEVLEEEKDIDNYELDIEEEENNNTIIDDVIIDDVIDDSQESNSTLNEDLWKYSFECIADFHSDITIETSGTIIVQENISIIANGNKFKRGFIRSLPTYRKNKYNRNIPVDFKVLKVTKNGVDEPYEVSKNANMLDIKIGDPNTYLSRNQYNYQILYKVDNQIGFFDSYDELYWNVTGNDWDFNIISASATINFPTGVQSLQNSCYTGKMGSTSNNCNYQIGDTKDGNQFISFISQDLSPQEGLTIATGFTPFVVDRGTALYNWLNFYGRISCVFLLFIIGIVYYTVNWIKYGKNAKKEIIVPTFEIPNNYSATAIRYLNKRKIDDKGFVCTIVQLAVKRYINIKFEDGTYTLIKNTNKPNITISKEEELTFNKLLESRNSLAIKKTSSKILNSAENKCSKTIEDSVHIGDFYDKNSDLKGIGFFYLMGGLISMFAIYTFPFEPLIYTLVGILVFGIITKVFKKIQSCLFLIFYIISIFGLFFLIPVILFNNPGSFLVEILSVLGLSILAYIIYVRMMTKNTTEGRKMEAQIKGLKMYLSTAEEHRLNMLYVPERTPELYEKMLPYAMALDLENRWGKKFVDVFQKINYQPTWINNSSHFSTSFGKNISASLASSISSATYVAPSSSSSSGSSWSSGSSGGGSSGGGGGGGGGRGW